MTRQYEAALDPPMGQQMQVDFGQATVRNTFHQPQKLWFMAYVLSHSRYKFMYWLDRPLTTADVIQVHEQAFAFYGGLPQEIVYDQDHLILVSENGEDLIYTKEFANYLAYRSFKVYMCKKGDPESKGKVENVVGYVKKNFARHRTYYNLAQWREDCLAWFERTGNGKVHQTTKKYRPKCSNRNIFTFAMRDQLQKIQEVMNQANSHSGVIGQALAYCLTYQLYSVEPLAMQCNILCNKQRNNKHSSKNINPKSNPSCSDINRIRK
ncbi:hypothetical protein GCM10010965_06980 [Caldalkalibacillus thermarum]|nr:hypothetical protein GCM10010965_06980 [Caldalkalibacillus thermarum]